MPFFAKVVPRFKNLKNTTPVITRRAHDSAKLVDIVSFRDSDDGYQPGPTIIPRVNPITVPATNRRYGSFAGSA